MSRSHKKVFSKAYQTRARKNSMDYDYLDQLSEDELKWFAQFNEEYYGASFKRNPVLYYYCVFEF